MTAERVKSGIPGLDVLLQGGFLRGGLYIIQGQPGAGKTILANQMCFARGRDGHKALFTTVLAETHARMMLHLGELSFYDDALVPKNVSYLSAFATLTADGVKGLLDVLRREMRAHGATILILDGFAAIEQAATSDLEFKRFVHELQVQSGMLGCTTFLLTSNRNLRGFNPEHTMVDGLIELNEEESLRRTERQIQISKFRGSSVLRGRHTYEITRDGLRVYPRTESLLRDVAPDDGDVGNRITSGVKELDKMLHGGFPQATSTLIVGSSGGLLPPRGRTPLGGGSARVTGLL
jgi:circadian clock protein KaiC